MVSVLNQTIGHHGAQSSYIMINSPVNTSHHSQLIESHFDHIGGPAACVILKYPVAWIGAACRRRGAVVVGDAIDNHRAFSRATFGNEHYAAMDAMMVQTEWHAAEVASWGYHAIVLPHAHGNLDSWSVATTTRRRLRGVGFVVSDLKNMPTRDDMRAILRACCHVNTTLYVINSAADGLRIHPYAHNCTDTEWFSENASGTAEASRRQAADGVASSAPQSPHLAKACQLARSAASHGHGGEDRLSAGAAVGVDAVVDSTRQRRYYESEALLRLVDVGLVWRPGKQQGGPVAIHNRPPTRMHWWFSHAIPVVGYPMGAYLDAARRVGYPLELLNVTSALRLEHALLSLAPPEARACLRQTASHGARVSSPWHSGFQLLASLCTLAKRCGKPLGGKMRR